MNSPVGRRPLSRRAFLRGAGAGIALPLLDAMAPASLSAAQSGIPRIPRRMVAIQTNMGIMPKFFFPEKAGRDYPLSPYLELLKDYRNDFTVFSGVSHPDVDGGHPAETVFLTAAPHPASSSFRNSISLDQFAAERFGAVTRFTSLTLLVSAQNNGTLSFTRSGSAIPGDNSPSALYRKLFVQGTAREVDSRIEDLRVGRSILDFVTDDAKRLQGGLGPRDRNRLEQYFTSVRALEGQLVSTEDWERRPKPKPSGPSPTDIPETKMLIERLRLMFNLIRFALETDSTRLITVYVNPANCVPAIPGVTRETHALSHHGNVPETVRELRLIEEAQFAALGDLLGGLRKITDGDKTLLDRTMVLYGSCMSNAHAHSNTNLPVLLAGGGFRHGLHLAFDQNRNYPLPNLFVSMLQRLGIEVDKFASSTGTMSGLEMA